jgi:tetratricopeptide (TPR) repeat protein
MAVFMRAILPNLEGAGCRTAAWLALLLWVPASGLAAQCQLKRAEIPVTMNGLRPTLTAQINGVDALFTLDSGAFWSSITPAAADQYKLHPDSSRLPGLYVIGVNGRADMKVATVNTFTFLNVPFHSFEFLVGGSDPGAGTVGLLGQNILRVADIEYDLAQGAVRFIKATNCKKDNLAYWVKAGESYSVVDIQTATAREPHTIATAYLNGAKIRVTFDTGSAVSIVGLRAAAKAGIKPDSPGVAQESVISGVGRQWVKTWMATFPSLKIGDEEVRNARLRFGDIGEIDMLLGADFFLSHRLYVASSQNKLYFTYNGGPVFNLAAAMARAQAATPTSEPALPASDSAGNAALDSTHPSGEGKEVPAAAAAPSVPPDPSAPTDASGFARRAAAFAARRDFEHALQDYNKACELAPNEAAYFYHRGLLLLETQKIEQGAADIETSIKLKPDMVEALFVRAEVELKQHATKAAVTDLDAVDRLSPKGAAIRYRLAGLYLQADQPQASIAQLDSWIASHGEDSLLPQALNNRCWNRAALNQALDKALDDCNRAVRLRPDSTSYLDSRAFVYLRSGAFDKAIADYNAVLKSDPKAAWSLYCRGVAKSRAGKTGDGAADMAAAAALNPRVTERAKGLAISVE